MHILITGGTGFIGAKLCQKLLANGHRLTVLTRQLLPADAGCEFVSRLDDIASDAHIEAVINLAGASLAGRRWTEAYKQEIFTSRLQTTRDLIALLKRLEHKPEVLLSASAIGYYGHHGNEILDESGSVVAGFSQELCEYWEKTAVEARKLGVRVCLLRLGVVLDSGGGAFTEMARPFGFGIANWLGNGQQWLSWVHRSDVVSAMLFLLQRPDLDGPFNITAPQPVTSRGFCEAMMLRKRTLLKLPVPALVLRVMLGEMARELLLNGQRVVPAALQEEGFAFEFPSLDLALADIL